VTSAYSSYSSCRQYLDDIEVARAKVGPAAPQVDKIRQYYNHPGFIAPNGAAVAQAASTLSGPGALDFDLVFTAHSIPAWMSETSGPGGGAYPAQLAEAARMVAAEAGYRRPWRLAYSSRSGPPSQPWLEPDVSDCVAELAAAGSTTVVVSPIGFVSDHMEVKFDLDVEAAQTASRLGLEFARAPTAGTDPRFVAMVGDLVRERLDGDAPVALGELGPGPDRCPAGCCERAGAKPPAARG
jgi:protoporphyrin/coproporphyrin ferrochelatase